MEKIGITFLGTGNAIPTKLRNHTSILISFKDENILLDCGEGTQRQLRHADISPTKISRILITHWHGDHVLGLPGLLQTLSMSAYNKILKLYIPPKTKKYLDYVSGLLNGIRIKLEVHEAQDTVIDENYFTVKTLPMIHQSPTNSYAIILKDKIRIKKEKLKKLNIKDFSLIKKLQHGEDIILNNKKITAKSLTYIEKGKKIAFIFDTAMTKNAIEIAKNADLLVIEATFSEKDKDRAEKNQHLTATQAAQIAKLSKSKALILTHLSQRYEAFPKIIEKEARKVFKNTRLVKDLDQIIL